MKYAATVALVALAGCEKSEPSDSYPPSSQPSNNTVDSSQGAAHSMAISDWRMQLELMESRINGLRQHSRQPTISPENKSDLDRTLKSLESQAGQIKLQLDNFNESDSMTWNSFSGDLNMEMTRLQKEVSEATDKFLNGAANKPLPTPTTPESPTNPPPETPQNPRTPPATPPQPEPAPAPAPGTPPVDPSNPR